MTKSKRGRYTLEFKQEAVRLVESGLHGKQFKTIREAKDETIAWLLWYNRTRMHSTLDYVSPMQFEQDWTETTTKSAA
jgi:putative transposase